VYYKEGVDKKARRQDPSRDFVNVWQEIGQQRIYVPSKQALVASGLMH
jgi:hypothetical protein